MKFLDKLFKKKYTKDFDDPYKICKKCKKFKTLDCPNSFHCFSRLDKPYFEENKTQD